MEGARTRLVDPPWRALLVFAAALVIIVDGSFALAAPPASRTAFIRVNQVGYPTAARSAPTSCRPSPRPAPRSPLTPAATTVFTGTDRRGSRLVEHDLPPRLRAGLHAVATAGTYTIAVDGPGRRPPRRPSGSPPARTCTRGAAPTRCRFYRNERDGANYIPSALRTAPAHLNDQTAMTYLTPHANASGRFKGDLSPLGATDRRVRRLVGRGRLPEVRPDDELHGRPCCSPASATSRRRWARARRRPNFTAEARFGAAVAAADVERHDAARSTTRWGSAPGTRTPRGDHDIWRLPQDDDTYRRHRPAVPLHPQPAGLPRRAARLADQPEPRRSRRRGASRCFQVFRTSDPKFADQLPARRPSTSSTSPTRRRAATCSP